MNKICTDISQSQKLIELGIDVNTADMCYPPYYMSDENSLYYAKKAENSTVDELSQNRPNKDEYIPAWSLTALLKVIPKHINNYYVLRIDIGDNDFAIWYDEIGYGVNNNLPNITMESAVDACYEMICQLKENGKI